MNATEMRAANPYRLAYLGAMVEYLFGIHRVTCIHDDRQHRVWHCDCADYERRLLKPNMAFCTHTVVTIGRTSDYE